EGVGGPVLVRDGNAAERGEQLVVDGGGVEGAGAGIETQRGLVVLDGVLQTAEAGQGLGPVEVGLRLVGQRGNLVGGRQYRLLEPSFRHQLRRGERTVGHFPPYLAVKLRERKWKSAAVAGCRRRLTADLASAMRFGP